MAKMRDLIIKLINKPVEVSDNIETGNIDICLPGYPGHWYHVITSVEEDYFVVKWVPVSEQNKNGPKFDDEIYAIRAVKNISGKLLQKE